MKKETTQNQTKPIDEALADIPRGRRSSQVSTATRQGFSAKGEKTMSTKTIQQRLADVMAENGLQEIKGKSSKYRVFRRPGFDLSSRKLFYYLGRAGALRTGPCIADSLSINASEWLKRHEKEIKR